MASSYTTNYQLNQWAAADKVLREEFNQDNAKIDGALAAIQSAVDQEADQRQDAVEAVAATVPQIVTGTYVGDGEYSQFIDLGFTPKAVYICHESGTVFSSAGWSYWGGLALPGKPAKRESCNIVSIATNGFQVYYRTDPYTVYSNLADDTFYYIALL